MPSQVLFAALLFVLTSLCILWRGPYRASGPEGLMFLEGITLMLIADHFIPYFKWSYNDVLWAAPASLVVLNADLLPQGLRRMSVLFCAGLFFISSSLLGLNGGLLVGEMAALLYLIFISTFLHKARVVTL